MPDLPLTMPPPFDVARLARVERMLDLGPHVGISPEDLARVQRRLVAHERERWQEYPSPERAGGLDRMIAQDVETLCLAFVRLRRVVEGMGSA